MSMLLVPWVDDEPPIELVVFSSVLFSASATFGEMTASALLCFVKMKTARQRVSLRPSLVQMAL